MMTTNCSENFNGVLKGARALPIQALVAQTFYQLVKYFYKRRTTAVSWTTMHTPRTTEHIRDRAELARSSQFRRYAHTKWEILDANAQIFDVIVQDEKCSCTCNRLKLQYLPCSHVI